ncbi:hypothetical protein CARUB_v10012374mg [Capsella rubella]|uniref:Uncharacterized protein n=1 Tax=Capsella rubella TaxID=81985 RepID=R0IL88_9BRAS|nr:uncharacterized protein LOC17900338 [Capsella rubella]EOA39330.1 hypothetical protein CARUB_v10012374mg [Capsella rubella]
MDDGGAIEIRRDEEQRERLEEIRRLNVRFLVAVALYLFTGVRKRAAGFIGSDPNSEDSVAFFWASKFNRAAEFSSLMVISTLITSTVAFEGPRRMRNLLVNCDIQLVLSFICLLISFAFSAYLCWFV